MLSCRELVIAMLTSLDNSVENYEYLGRSALLSSARKSSSTTSINKARQRGILVCFFQ